MQIFEIASPLIGLFAITGIYYYEKMRERIASASRFRSSVLLFIAAGVMMILDFLRVGGAISWYLLIDPFWISVSQFIPALIWLQLFTVVLIFPYLVIGGWMVSDLMYQMSPMPSRPAPNQNHRV